MPSGAGKRKGVSGGGAKKKVAIDVDELADAQAEFQSLVGPLPGGPWRMNLKHLQKKIAEAKAKRGPRGRTGGKGAKGPVGSAARRAQKETAARRGNRVRLARLPRLRQKEKKEKKKRRRKKSRVRKLLARMWRSK